MKRGIEILIEWLVVVFLVHLFVPISIPGNLLASGAYLLSVASFPFGALFYARHANRVSPVICFGLIAGAFTIMPVFHDAWGRARYITTGWEIVIAGGIVLMTLACVGFYVLGRYLYSEEERHEELGDKTALKGGTNFLLANAAIVIFFSALSVWQFHLSQNLSERIDAIVTPWMWLGAFFTTSLLSLRHPFLKRIGVSLLCAVALSCLLSLIKDVLLAPLFEL